MAAAARATRDEAQAERDAAFARLTAVAMLPTPATSIADSLLDAIFEYGVSDGTADGQGEGRGQGLFVARTYMAKMGGTITATNTEGGVAFLLRLPRATPRTPA